MKSSLAFLCLWICLIVAASRSNGCSNIPEVEDAQVAESSKKDIYSDGDKLEYNCITGYVSLKKIIFKCSNNEWKKERGDKCLSKRCESPEDIPNGRYTIESGKAFFFGTTIKYICNEGYQMMSRFDTRTCRDGGWDNQLPACEEASCERKTPEENVQVEGFPDFLEDLIRYGHRLTFSCAGSGLMVKGQKEVTCQSNGQWSGPFPTCVEATCPLQWSTTGDLRIDRLPPIEGPVKPGNKLTFSCTRAGLRLYGERVITCQSNGEWSSPFPTCEEINCKAEQLINVDILIGHPNTATPYKPGHILVFQCTDVTQKMHGQKTIECLSDGKWDHPYPRCEEVTCEAEQLISVDILMGHPGTAPPYKPGHILVFRCTDVNLKMYGQRAIECQSNGKWNYPYPKCGDNTCEVPRDQHVHYPYDYFRGNMKVGAKQYYYCESGYEKMAEEATCTRDGWTPKPLCTNHKCEVPRDQQLSYPGHYFSGDMKLGAKINYRCMSGYEKMATEATCTQDGWTPKPLCTNHKCEVPRDQHVSRPQDYFRGDMKVGAKQNYRCESGYEKMAAQATCTQDGWTPNPLCAVMTGTVKCGPPTKVDNADTKDMTKNEYNTGERVEYICFNKYTLDERPPFSKYLTCRQGQWSGNIKCLKPCTVTVDIMNERGIELAYADDQKMFATHNDHITFKCQRGKYTRDTVFRRQCNDGDMPLPQCV